MKQLKDESLYGKCIIRDDASNYKIVDINQVFKNIVSSANWEEVYMNNLKEIRLKKGLSQSKLAAKADVNLAMIQKYEQGSKDINKAEAMTIYKLAQALDITMESLLEIKKEVE